MRGQRGVTVIELLVVLVIIAVLIAVTVPSFGEQSVKAQDSVTAQKLATAYRVAAAEAASRGGVMPSRAELAEAIRGDAPGIGQVRVAVDHGEWSRVEPGIVLIGQSGHDGAIGNRESLDENDAATVELTMTSESGNACRLRFAPRSHSGKVMWAPCPYLTDGEFG